MSTTIDPRTRELIEKHLTPRQRDVMLLVGQGFGWRRIGMVLGVDPKSAKDAFERGSRRLAPYLTSEDA